MTLNSLDPSDPSIFGMLSALSDPEEAPAAPPPKAKADPFAMLSELGGDDAQTDEATPAPAEVEDPFALLSQLGDDADRPAENEAPRAAAADPFALLAGLGDDDDETEEATPAPTEVEDPFALLSQLRGRRGPPGGKPEAPRAAVSRSLCLAGGAWGRH